MNLQIEPATEDDASELMALHRSVLEEGRYFITLAEEFHNSVDRQRLIMRHLISQDNSCLLLARSQSQLIGMVLIRGGFLRRMAHVGKLEIFLRTDCREKGAGRTLMNAALDWARAHTGLTKIGLSVFEDNERAVQLYRSMGFQIEGRRVAEYQDPDGVLRNDLLMWIGV